jgi:hypothetical protein
MESLSVVEDFDTVENRFFVCLTSSPPLAKARGGGQFDEFIDEFNTDIMQQKDYLFTNLRLGYE